MANSITYMYSIFLFYLQFFTDILTLNLVYFRICAICYECKDKCEYFPPHTVVNILMKPIELAVAFLSLFSNIRYRKVVIYIYIQATK